MRIITESADNSIGGENKWGQQVKVKNNSYNN